MTNSSPKINVLYTKFEYPLADSKFNDLLNFLPDDQIERNQRFIRWQDRHSHLLGRMLLKNGLEMYGLSSNCLSDLQYNKYDRPYIDDSIDFNISHSGNYVICAISQVLKLGIDIEKVKEIKFSDFKKVMTDEQWQDIKYDDNPPKAFFKYWTIKESVIKADSRGLSIPLQDIHVRNNKVHYDNTLWYLYQLNIDPEYCSCLATNINKVDITFSYIDFFKENDNRSIENESTFNKTSVEKSTFAKSTVDKT